MAFPAQSGAAGGSTILTTHLALAALTKIIECIKLKKCPKYMHSIKTDHLGISNLLKTVLNLGKGRNFDDFF